MNEWQTFLAIAGGISIIAGAVRVVWPMIRAAVAASQLIEAQLKPNAGTSLLDRVANTETQVEEIAVIVKQIKIDLAAHAAERRRSAS